MRDDANGVQASLSVRRPSRSESDRALQANSTAKKHTISGGCKLSVSSGRQLLTRQAVRVLKHWSPLATHPCRPSAKQTDPMDLSTRGALSDLPGEIGLGRHGRSGCHGSLRTLARQRSSSSSSWSHPITRDCAPSRKHLPGGCSHPARCSLPAPPRPRREPQASPVPLTPLRRCHRNRIPCGARFRIGRLDRGPAAVPCARLHRPENHPCGRPVQARFEERWHDTQGQPSSAALAPGTA